MTRTFPNLERYEIMERILNKLIHADIDDLDIILDRLEDYVFSIDTATDKEIINRCIQAEQLSRILLIKKEIEMYKESGE
ncbi:hypothetical protein P9E05_14095 [Bacillus mojavensis]|uniref:hypothetical protein n=1 Tax=Bacillus mojavensis TaxID=72360 RepID=UPI002DBB10B2|nr:hypothetical protein [Bacillus mojavensis]MEC1692610.1 hypothetical protein [Bacillus mojavensis]